MRASGAEAEGVTWGEPAARWILLATVLGSGMAFLDTTVVDVALPTIGVALNASVGTSFGKAAPVCASRFTSG